MQLTLLDQKENENIHLFVDKLGQWTTGSDKLTSAAAGDMNPASERNSYCKDCAWRGAEMTSWAYSKDGNDLMIQSDKIKVSCENIEEDGSGDWHNAEILHESAKGSNVKGTKAYILGIDYNENLILIFKIRYT